MITRRIFMRNYNKLIISFLILINSPSLHAKDLRFEPYIGVDIQARNTPFANGFGEKLFAKTSPQANLYFGIKINKVLAIELGRSMTAKKSRDAFFSNNSIYLGSLNQQDSIGTGIKNVREWNLNLLGFLPLFKLHSLHSIDFVGLIGAGNVEVRLKELKTAQGINQHEIINLRAKKTIFRVGGGFQNMITENLGLRALIVFENTAKFNNIAAHVPFDEIAKLKNSIVYGVGLFVQF